MSVLCTLVGIQAKQGVLAAEADAERPASRGGAFGVRNLHKVDVTVDGDKIHGTQRVGANAGLSEGRPHLVPQLQRKLEEHRWRMPGRSVLDANVHHQLTMNSCHCRRVTCW